MRPPNCSAMESLPIESGNSWASFWPFTSNRSVAGRGATAFLPSSSIREPQDGEAAGLVLILKFDHPWDFDFAGFAPRGPEIHQNDLPLELSQGNVPVLDALIERFGREASLVALAFVAAPRPCRPQEISGRPDHQREQGHHSQADENAFFMGELLYKAKRFRNPSLPDSQVRRFTKISPPTKAAARRSELQRCAGGAGNAVKSAENR